MVKLEVVLIVKTLEEKFKEIEKEVVKIHSYHPPCIFSVNVNKVHQPYLDWLKEEIKQKS